MYPYSGHVFRGTTIYYSRYRHCSLAVINSLHHVAMGMTEDLPIRNDFLIHLLEMFVQLGLQARKICEKTHTKVSARGLGPMGSGP